jgi:hypothetical protein
MECPTGQKHDPPQRRELGFLENACHIRLDIIFEHLHHNGIATEVNPCETVGGDLGEESQYVSSQTFYLTITMFEHVVIV